MVNTLDKNKNKKATERQNSIMPYASTKKSKPKNIKKKKPIIVFLKIKMINYYFFPVMKIRIIDKNENSLNKNMIGKYFQSVKTLNIE